jgi:hypothetical protein
MQPGAVLAIILKIGGIDFFGRTGMLCFRCVA